MSKKQPDEASSASTTSIPKSAAFADQSGIQAVFGSSTWLQGSIHTSIPLARGAPRQSAPYDSAPRSTPESTRSVLLASIPRDYLLSPKEVAVLLEAALGAEDKEIAFALDCSISTVRTLWQRIYVKAGSVSRRKILSVVWQQALGTTMRA